MAEELKTYKANVFMPGCLGPVRRDVVLLDDHNEIVAELRAQLHGLQGAGEAVAWLDPARGLDWLVDRMTVAPGTKLYTRPADPDAVAVAVQRWELQGFASELARIIHDARTPNETSQELASLLIAVRALLAGEEGVKP